MQLRYESKAEQDLLAVVDFGIDNDLPDPVGFVRELRQRIVTLATQPNSGRAGRLPGTREWPLAGTPYLVVYKVSAASIDVLRVLPPQP
ncbi:MAG TPA: type II toxin-antitoxin system RelE/ParE family toxin [Rhodanobacteraceae bacterium]|nr:type II toxin-antitoxin system RelE/ParE family toxin [Rhodanobacteraceae bacterium]